ncbi:MAG: DUF402 domain-containing protein [Bacilli bacterium]|nr:DUF402 domain-containing protein [Bacilli bacterium]
MCENNQPFRRWKKVQAYKHDGTLHRQWSPAFLVFENDDCWVLASKASLVTEFDGRKWMTKEKAIFVLFKKKWMNVIAMFKQDRGICYYVNIASPTIYDGGYLRYIDYDLDVKVYPDGVEKTLDEREYDRHATQYGYPKDLSQAIEASVVEVKKMIEKKEMPFDDSLIEGYYQTFLEMNKPVTKRPA